MSNRRVPLANVPNATNSPYRAVAAAAAKRARSHSSVQREIPYGQPPPAKKQILEVDQVNLHTPPRQQSVQHAEGRVFARRTTNTQPTAFERRLVAARDRQTQQEVVSSTARNEKILNENLDTIRQWQKHYRKVFPEYVFYFESISEDIRLKCSKQVTTLGAREEKFFSRAVTHVVTTRLIPPEIDTMGSLEPIEPSSTTAVSHADIGHPTTINPSLLERSSESAQTQAPSQPPKSNFTFQASAIRKLQSNGRPEVMPELQDAESRKHPSHGDTLYKARQMGMKIWALEKLQRMMTTMYDTDTGFQPQHCHNTRGNAAATVGVLKANRDADLSQLLRNERLNGPSDRDHTVATKDLAPFKGPFIYVHDMDEKTRPVMAREYPKVSHKEDGAWPQFRSVSNGKCPFVEEVVHSNRDKNKGRARERDAQLKLMKESKGAPRTRSTAALGPTRMQPPRANSSKPVLTELENGVDATTWTAADAPEVKLFDPRKAVSTKRGSPEGLSRPSHDIRTGFGGTSLYGGEPIASGVQPSNITSAIRSQMISSTAAAPGAKAGTSKEVYELKRKVLEKNSAPSANSIVSRATDIAATSRLEKATANARAAKRKATEKLGYIDEDFTLSEEEENARRLDVTKAASALHKRNSERRDSRPGYCENCRDKFDDFDEHIISRKHRKFAVTSDNWAELDALLGHLGRPLREV
ncbi:MAG: hypothetical protein M1827_007652 [Pycnora praestabilis]|nr:MAG: hypothetical protein M1827_007652 [Pycnora praestabilis]